MTDKSDIHVHAWTEEIFFEMLEYVVNLERCNVDARISVVNENIYVIQRL